MNKQKVFLLIIGLLTLHIALSGFIPLTDPSEARYATIAKDMATSNDYVTPRIWIEGKLIPFMGKPPLGFWAIAASVEIFGANEFAVRLPAFIASMLLLLIIFYTLKRYQSFYHATTATLITATTGGFYILSGVVLVDMWLCLFSIGAVFWYYAFIQEKERKIKKLFSLLVFLFLAGAFLTKGPVGLVYFGLPVFFWTLLSNRWDTLKDHAWVTGILLFLIVIIPWFIFAEKATPGFCEYFFVNENYKRFVTPNYGDLYSGTSHTTPKGMAILFSLAVCLPWSLILIVFYCIHKKSAILADIKPGIANIKKCCFKHSADDFDLFLVGTLAITLFWCISSQLMLYYLILVTPLFGAWCANIFAKYAISSKAIVKLSILLLTLYAIGAVPAFFIVKSKKSAKDIVHIAIEIRENKKLEGQVIFAREIPYSAYFYGGNLILPHEKELVKDSMMRNSQNKGDIFILKKKYLKRIPGETQQLFEVDYQDKNWALVTKKQVSQ